MTRALVLAALVLAACVQTPDQIRGRGPMVQESLAGNVPDLAACAAERLDGVRTVSYGDPMTVNQVRILDGGTRASVLGVRAHETYWVVDFRATARGADATGYIYDAIMNQDYVAAQIAAALRACEKPSS